MPEIGDSLDGKGISMTKNNKSQKLFPKRLTVLVEPFGGCNLRCRHCYYAKTNYPKGEMSIDTLDRFLKISVPNYDAIKIIWHGGEPLLRGYDFFEKAYALFEKYSKEYNIKFYFNLQTNGTLIDKRFLKLFSDTGTFITISYDGQFNNVLRQNTSQVEEKMQLLKDNGVEFSCLSTISSASVHHMIEEYEFFNEKEISVKFNPINPDGAAKENKDYLMAKEEWTGEFIKLFDYWFFDKKCKIDLAPCGAILRKFLCKEAINSCLTGTCLFSYLAIDYKGDLYPCGRMIEQSFNIGNVFDYEDIRYAYLYKNYSNILKANETRMKSCNTCKWFSKCHAGCNAESHIYGDMSKRNDFGCYFTRTVFEHIEKLLENYETQKTNEKALFILDKYKTTE